MRGSRAPESDHVDPAFSCFFPLTPPKSHENPMFPLPLQIKDSWDHAQMIERKILCRIALTRALYDQIRPYFFQKYSSNFVSVDPPVPPPNKIQKSTPSDHLDLPVGGKENSNWPDLYAILIHTGPIVIFLPPTGTPEAMS